MSTWEDRMADRARDRQRALDEAVWKAVPVEDKMCMTGDGNVAAFPSTSLCIYCLNRPYGERRLRTEAERDEDYCEQCWGSWLIWMGNTWGNPHVDPPGLYNCDHDCHEGEIWLAAAS